MSRSAKNWLSKAIFYIKNDLNLSNFLFSLLQYHSLLLKNFTTSIWNTLYSRLCPISTLLQQTCVTMVSWFRWWVDLDFLLLSFLINIYRNQPNPSQNLFCLDSINFFVSSNTFIRKLSCKQIQVNSLLNSTHHCDTCLLQFSVHGIQ